MSRGSFREVWGLARPDGRPVAVGAEGRLDRVLDLVVRQSLFLQLAGQDRLVHADPAARRVFAREAGQEGLVAVNHALLALAEAVKQIERRRVLPGDLVRGPGLRLVDPRVGEEAR